MMIQRPFRAFLFLCLAAGFLSAQTAFAGTHLSTQQAKLRRLRHTIAQLTTQIDRELDRKHAVSAQLGRLEANIGQLTKTVAQMTRHIQGLEKRKTQLEQAATKARKTSKRIRTNLARELRAVFILGREPRIQLALEGDNPANIERLMAYYRYFSRARAKKIASLSAKLAKLRKINQKLARTTTRLLALTRDRRHKLAKLRQERQSRQAILVKLNHDLKNKHHRLAKLKEDAHRLAHILNTVEADVSSSPQSIKSVDFPHLRGKLPWPVNTGHIIDQFGAQREGDLRWEAIQIRAPAGTPVKAIAPGRVVYAGWLPFYGLIIIIDHGHGYLTVYGHNQALYRKVGDRVRAGEILATVGKSGGQRQAALYFQLRHRNHPLDPNRWIRHR